MYTEEMGQYQREQAEKLTNRNRACANENCGSTAEIGGLCQYHHDELVAWSRAEERRILGLRPEGGNSSSRRGR
jgi:hypothetical protein